LSIIVLYTRKRLHMSVFYAVAGVAYMALATQSYLNDKRSDRIYAYKFTITEIPKNVNVRLAASSPWMYLNDRDVCVHEKALHGVVYDKTCRTD